MTERQTILKLQTITYSGPFHVGDLYKFINDWLLDHRYDVLDQDHSESVKPDGKYIELVMRPWIIISKSAKFRFWIDIKLTRIKDIELKIDGKPRRLQEGEAWIGLRAYLEKDTEDKWESNPVYMVFRTIFNTFVYPSSNKGLSSQFKSDIEKFKSDLKAFFNLYKKQ